MSQINTGVKQRKGGQKIEIRIIGKFQKIYKQNQKEEKLIHGDPQNYEPIDLETGMGYFCPELLSKPYGYLPKPKKIYVDGNLIAYIDQLDNLWFMSNMFEINVNVSVLLGRKVKSVSLSENECIITNKRNPILLNWGAKKIIDVENMEMIKINDRLNKSCGNYFTAYSILQSNRDDRFLYSNIKKIDNSNKLYQLKSQSNNAKLEMLGKSVSSRHRNRTHQTTEMAVQDTHEIIAYPTLQRSSMRNKVVGISVGKYHCMCWDICGQLYTWGNRSLALGYEELPHEKITVKPTLVRKMNKFVTMAFAATHYSLALSSDGNIYEWGIKKIANQLNEQLIFEPKILRVGQTSSKTVMLKGSQEVMACLNSHHQLYIWGERATRFLPASLRNSPIFQNGIIYEPFRVPRLDNTKIIDFGIGDEFIAVLTSNSDSMIMGEEEKMYWDELLRRVKGKLKLFTAKTEGLEAALSRSKCSNLLTSQALFEVVPFLEFFPPCEPASAIEKSYQERSIKREYFKSLKNSDKLYTALLRFNHHQNSFNDDSAQTHKNPLKMRASLASTPLRSFISKRQFHIKKNSMNSSAALMSCQRDLEFKTQPQASWRDSSRVLQCRNSSFNSSMLNNQAKLCLSNNTNQTAKKMMGGRKKSSDFENVARRSQMIEFKKFSIEPYEERLEKVQRKKKSIEEHFNMQMTKTMEVNSIEYRMQRHNQIIEAKTNAKQHNILKYTLQNFLIKHFVIKVLTAPIDEARNIKIELFAKNLHLSRIQKNLRRVFAKSRVISRLKKLPPSTYALLCRIFRQYVGRRRAYRIQQKRKLVTQQLYKHLFHQKVRAGLCRTQLVIRKLQKFREWLVITKVERIRCLKVLWKNYLPQVMRVTHDSDAILLCKTQENCTFESLYRERVAANPMLKLQHFLDSNNIFSLKYDELQSSVLLLKRDNKMRSQKTLKSFKADKRKQRIKFSGSEQREYFTSLTNIPNYADLLPYSLHYNLFVRPKSMEVNILENMKRNERWIQTQRTIFNKCLKEVIDNHERQLFKARNRYDRELAFFIKQKYEVLSQKRWKCIVEFNQLKQTSKKDRKLKEGKEKELYRLFDLIGMQKTLNEDCLPEKYLMLEEALKKRDGPVPPSPYIVFGLGEFKVMLKKYYECISVQAKQMRSRYV